MVHRNLRLYSIRSFDATINLALASKAVVMSSRGFVLQDIKDVGPDVLKS